VVFGTLFSALWVKLARHNRNPSTPMKFILGLLGLGLVGLWVIYRIVRGWLALHDGRAMPMLAPLP